MSEGTLLLPALSSEDCAISLFWGDAESIKKQNRLQLIATGTLLSSSSANSLSGGCRVGQMRSYGAWRGGGFVGRCTRRRTAVETSFYRKTCTLQRRALKWVPSALSPSVSLSAQVNTGCSYICSFKRL
ncbi:hypothetical protein SLE2022_215800 [Rubroshorea leprosula]